MVSKHDSRQPEIRVLALDLPPILLNMGSKHDSHQQKKFVYWPSTYSLSVQNMGSKHDFAPTVEIRVLSRIYSVYGLETWLAPTVEILANLRKDKFRIVELEHPN